MKLISIFSIIAALTSVNVHCQTIEDQKPKPSFTDNQVDLLTFALETAKSDGHKNPSYILGILMQESKAGETKDFRVSGSPKSISSRVFGIAQIKLAAALAVMKRWPEMWSFLDTHTNEELQARLILDDRFNIRVASKYALLMGMNDHPNKAIASYNLGQGGVEFVNPKTYKYTIAVKKHAARIEKFTQGNK
jgi:hypothetical protein